MEYMTAVNEVADERNEVDAESLLCVDHQKCVEYLRYVPGYLVYHWYPEVAVMITVAETVGGFSLEVARSMKGSVWSY